jgi:hypothetical protein
MSQPALRKQQFRPPRKGSCHEKHSEILPGQRHRPARRVPTRGGQSDSDPLLVLTTARVPHQNGVFPSPGTSSPLPTHGSPSRSERKRRWPRPSSPYTWGSIRHRGGPQSEWSPVPRCEVHRWRRGWSSCSRGPILTRGGPSEVIPLSRRRCLSSPHPWESAVMTVWRLQRAAFPPASRGSFARPSLFAWGSFVRLHHGRIELQAQSPRVGVSPGSPR